MAVTAQCARHGGVQLKEHFHRLVLQGGRQHDREIAQQFIQTKRRIVQFQLAGLDLGKVQNVVEDGQQGTCRPFRLVDVVALACIQPGALHELQQAQYGVHRRANFVAHVGDKFAFGATGRFRLDSALCQRGVRGLGLCICLAAAALGQVQAGHRDSDEQCVNAANQGGFFAPTHVHRIEIATDGDNDGFIHLQGGRLYGVKRHHAPHTGQQHPVGHDVGRFAAFLVAQEQGARLGQIHPQQLLLQWGNQEQLAIAMGQCGPGIRGITHRFERAR